MHDDDNKKGIVQLIALFWFLFVHLFQEMAEFKNHTKEASY